MRAYEYLSEVGVPEKYLFASFDSGLESINALGVDEDTQKRYHKIYSLAKKVTQDKEVGVYFYGHNGSGKSYLGIAMLRGYLLMGLSVARTTPREVLDWYFHDFQGMRPRYFSADVLLVEEIGKEVDYKSGEAKKIIEELVKGREERGKITLYTANAPQKDLAGRYGETVFQVIKGLSLEVYFPEFDFRRHNLAEYAQKNIK